MFEYILLYVCTYCFIFEQERSFSEHWDLLTSEIRLQILTPLSADGCANKVKTLNIEQQKGNNLFLESNT